MTRFTRDSLRLVLAVHLSAAFDATRSGPSHLVLPILQLVYRSNLPENLKPNQSLRPHRVFRKGLSYLPAILVDSHWNPSQSWRHEYLTVRRETPVAIHI